MVMVNAEGEEKGKEKTAGWSLGKGLLESFNGLRTEADAPIVLKKVDWITTLTIRSGYLFITEEKLVFLYNYYEEKDNDIAIVKHKLSTEQSFIKEWPLDHIK